MTEIWRPVFGYEDRYEVSNAGRVRTIERTGSRPGKQGRIFKVDQKIRTPAKGPRGYLSISLCKDGINKSFILHRIVAIAFLPNPECLPQVNHKNGIKHDNRIENLEWNTASQNVKHTFEVLGRVTHNRKLNKSKILEILKMKKSGLSAVHIAEKFNIHPAHVHKIVKGVVWPIT